MVIDLMCPLLSLLAVQDPHQPGLQQRCHSGRSQEERLPAEPGEAALEKQRHSATKLTAATHLRDERIGTVATDVRVFFLLFFLKDPF